jgi:two-component system sensor histidine kinase/response regulator
MKIKPTKTEHQKKNSKKYDNVDFNLLLEFILNSDFLKNYMSLLEVEMYRQTQDIDKANKLLKVAKEKAIRLAKKATQANKAKSDFLAAMSHEIRTPLNGVIGMTGLLLETPLSPEQSEFTETIRLSGEALLGIINDILDFSKIESNRLELDQIDFEVQNIVFEAIEINIAHAYRKKVEINAYIEPNVPRYCVGDPVRLRQVLNNLISNAVKFTKNGEISIWVMLKEKNFNTAELQFEIRDTGIGIESHLLHQLFKPFSQAGHSVARKYGGTGLGLVISKKLVHLMNGEIGVESTAGLGSKFWFTAQFNLSLINDTTEKYHLDKFKGKRLLCIDSNPTSGEVIKRTTESWKMHCDVVDNVVDAVTMLKNSATRNNKYSMIMLDYRLPDLNRSDLKKVFQEINAVSSIPIVVMLPVGFNFGINHIKKMGIETILTKPIHPRKLFECFMTIFENVKTSGEDKLHIEEFKIQKNARILLAEDNFINQQVCLRILHKLGLQAETVITGIEAVDAVKSKEFDLILMDCQMPDMDGYEASTVIRELKGKEKEIPIVAMTANALVGDREKCINAGMNDYISKPINIRELAAILSRWLPASSS